MLAVSTLRNNNKDENQGEILDRSFSINGVTTADDPHHEHYNSFINDSSSDTNFLDSIDFDDIFLGINGVDSLLPDLAMDPDILAEFLLSPGPDDDQVEKLEDNKKKKIDDEDDKLSGSYSGTSGLTSSNTSSFQEEILSKKNESDVVMKQSSQELADHKNRSSKSSAYNFKNSRRKRKVKVDWTPELHRGFVQAVEQLGVDKAVPSRILELMGIDCLTRHNIASHLQKYRSHRKHLLAREAEAASWNQRRQTYGSVAGGGGGGGKTDTMNPNWVVPTMGFPSITPMHHFRPLHVWGHPPIHDHSLHHIWPKHLPHPRPPAITWPQPGTPPLLSPDPNSYWHHPHQHRVPSSQAVPGFPPHGVYKVAPSIDGLRPAGKSVPQPLFDIYPPKESIDAAIGEVLSKPGLPLPLGLKPPSHDGIVVELERQGLQEIPPSSRVSTGPQN